MSKLLLIFGVVLGAMGLAFGIVGLIAPERLSSFAMSFDTAAIFLVGGLLVAGLSSVLGLLEKLVSDGIPTATAAQPSLSTDRLKFNPPPPKPELAEVKPAFVPPPPPPPVPPLRPVSLPPVVSDDFRSAAASVAATAAAASTAAASSISLSEKSIPDLSTPAPNPSVAEAINALEQAKTDMRAALGGNLNKPQPPYPEVAIPPPHDLPEDEEIVEEVVEEETSDSGELYVVEEKMIRGRPARILSDGTVEAETDDGWMRFENVEHLNEYLDG
jgi:hypothetical protein